MKIEDIKPGMKVAYVPKHARGDLTHPDVDRGVVARCNSDYAFVRFDVDGFTTKACRAEDLVARSGLYD